MSKAVESRAAEFVSGKFYDALIAERYGNDLIVPRKRLENG